MLYSEKAGAGRGLSRSLGRTFSLTSEASRSLGTASTPRRCRGWDWNLVFSDQIQSPFRASARVPLLSAFVQHAGACRCPQSTWKVTDNEQSLLARVDASTARGGAPGQAVEEALVVRVVFRRTGFEEALGRGTAPGGGRLQMWVQDVPLKVCEDNGVRVQAGVVEPQGRQGGVSNQTGLAGALEPRSVCPPGTSPPWCGW